MENARAKKNSLNEQFSDAEIERRAFALTTAMQLAAEIIRRIDVLERNIGVLGLSGAEH